MKYKEFSILVTDAEKIREIPWKYVQEWVNIGFCSSNQYFYEKPTGQRLQRENRRSDL